MHRGAPLRFIGNPNGTQLLYKGPLFLFLSHAPPIGLSFSPYPKQHPAEKMQYHGPTFHRPRTTPEQQYPPGTIVETTLQVEGPVDLARDFLADGIAHLPRGSPVMYRLNEVCDGVTLKLLTVTFTNPFDAYELLDKVFCCGCESIFFTNYNIFTNRTIIFPTRNHMHCLPYDK
jgi:hypothetical protein